MRRFAYRGKRWKKRIARFENLKPLPIQNASIRRKARDVVYRASCFRS